MQIVIPLAGFGTRLRPHTWSKPKPLINVAGKAVLGHILDTFDAALDISEVTFIVGWLGDQIKEYVSAHYDFPAEYVVQEELKGQAHAIYLAKEHLHGPCMIVFVDTLFEADLSNLEKRDVDGVMYVQEVEDPRRFGVIVEEAGRVTQIVEKPDTCENRKVVIGLYYVRDGKALVDAIEHLLEQGIQTKGEYYLADAFQVMIDRGAHFVSQPVSMWEDCGKPETVLHTNRYLLDHGHAQEVETTRSVLIPPVHIAPSAVIEDSVVGPHVTVGEGARIVRSIVSDSIVDQNSTLENVNIHASLIGRNATARGHIGSLNVGDNDVIDN